MIATASIVETEVQITTSKLQRMNTLIDPFQFANVMSYRIPTFKPEEYTTRNLLNGN